MTAVTLADRVLAWNIMILDCPPSNGCLAGAYQSMDVPFLTWKDFYLLLRFHLGPSVAASNAPLALYLVHGKDVLAHNPNTPFLYYNFNKPGSEEQLSQFIRVTVLNRSESPNLHTTYPKVSLIFHDFAHCKGTQDKLVTHLQSGMLDHQ